jgi:predicted porin
MRKFIVILAVIALVGAFTATAMADVELYGSARFRTYYADVDDGAGPHPDTDGDLEWRQGFLARFGANFKSDKVTGKFELDSRTTDNIESGSQASSVGMLRLRHLWGEYDFGAGKLMIGQNFPLFDAPVSNIAYYSGGLQKFGGMGYTVARTGQIRLTFGNLRLAFLPPDTNKGGLGAFSEVNTTFPKAELRYDMKMDAFSLNFIGGYQTYEIEDLATRNTEDISSYVLGVRGKVDLGPFYVGAGLNYRQNGGNYGVWTTSSKESAALEGGSIKDAEGIGFVAAAGWKINDMFSLEASYASLTTEQDTGPANEDDEVAYGLMAKIALAPGVIIQPELIFEDNKDVVNDGISSDEGDKTIFGVWWLINFK